MIFAPDDFRDAPYTAGLNQMGHVVFGAALVVLFDGWVLAAAIFLSWEMIQLKYGGAHKHDCFQDCAFWATGVILTGSEWLPVTAVLMGGAWMGVTWLLKK